MRITRFARSLPTTIRLSGGILNPWLMHNLRAAWLQTGPPPPPVELTDEEWEAFSETLEEMH